MNDEVSANPNEGEQSQDAEKKSLKPRRSFEISEEAKEERRLLAAFLLQQTEELKKERNLRKQKIEEQLIELRSGKTISISEVRQYVTSLKRRYKAIFPNSNDFFPQMFRLHPKLQGHNPHQFIKPYLAGQLLKKLTYSRFPVEFGTDVLPALVVLAMPGGVRLHNCHEYLTDTGVIEFTRFRDEANAMMKEYKDLDWYGFDKAYSEKYKLPFQPRLW